MHNFARLTTSAIFRAVPKIITIGCVGEPHTYAKYNVLCGVFVSSSAFSGSRTARRESRTEVSDGSKDLFSVQELPFLDLVDDVTLEEVVNPQTAVLTQKGSFQHRLMKILDKTSFVRGRQKITIM